ncbi:hypothetical protein AXF42_Ash003837 [Apostasia shenzhenica]|uniref:Uncharacterized protein n=1 Tax=Apostasia shenzhenica TaxID=1088818 RepID=A0A2I0AI33_9ASPA|nr:hypothetical protein AXF42_Ash003837 [Apostasia shenzhenica]
MDAGGGVADSSSLDVRKILKWKSGDRLTILTLHAKSVRNRKRMYTIQTIMLTLCAESTIIGLCEASKEPSKRDTRATVQGEGEDDLRHLHDRKGGGKEMEGCKAKEFSSQGVELSTVESNNLIRNRAEQRCSVSSDNERAYFDSADWALGKLGANVGQKTGVAVESLRPKLQYVVLSLSRERHTINCHLDGPLARPSKIIRQPEESPASRRMMAIAPSSDHNGEPRIIILPPAPP